MFEGCDMYIHDREADRERGGRERDRGKEVWKQEEGEVLIFVPTRWAVGVSLNSPRFCCDVPRAESDFFVEL